MSKEVTIGDLAGIIQLAQSSIAGLDITDFGEFFSVIRDMLNSYGQLTPELDANLRLAEQQLSANPNLFGEGKQLTIDALQSLLDKYPSETPLSEIPEFQDDGSGTGPTPPPVDPDPDTDLGLVIRTLDLLRDKVTVDFDAESGVVHVNGAGYDFSVPDLDRLEFTDGTLAFDFDGVSGSMFRLYQAVFGREPDDEGLGYWIRHQDNGQSSFEDVIRSFMDSPEFSERYGSEETLSNSEFISHLYQNVLGRDYDTEGFTYWNDKLDTGQTNRADLLAFFSDSDENIIGTADAMADGIWFV